MPRLRLPWWWILAATLQLACTSDTTGGLAVTAHPDQFLDYNEFVCHVQPILIKRCSFLACHGDSHHAFRLYSLGKLRMVDTPTRAARSVQLLSADEVEANFESTSGLLYANSAAERSAADLSKVLLLGQAMAAKFGGSEHKGVAMFPAWPAATPDDDPEWQALKAWVAGAKQPSPVEPDCAAWFALMMLSPR
jgi:hypothetical protein